MIVKGNNQYIIPLGSIIFLCCVLLNTLLANVSYEISVLCWLFIFFKFRCLKFNDTFLYTIKCSLPLLLGYIVKFHYCVV